MLELQESKEYGGGEGADRRARRSLQGRERYAKLNLRSLLNESWDVVSSDTVESASDEEKAQIILILSAMLLSAFLTLSILIRPPLPPLVLLQEAEPPPVVSSQAVAVQPSRHHKENDLRVDQLGRDEAAALLILALMQYEPRLFYGELVRTEGKGDLE